MTRDDELREFLLALRRASLQVVRQIDRSKPVNPELQKFMQTYRRASLLVVRQIEERYQLKPTE